MLVVIVTTGISYFYDTKYSIYLLNFCFVFSIVYGYMTISIYRREKVKQNRCLLILQGIIYAINICIITFFKANVEIIENQYTNTTVTLLLPQ